MGRRIREAFLAGAMFLGENAAAEQDKKETVQSEQAGRTDSEKAPQTYPGSSKHMSEKDKKDREKDRKKYEREEAKRNAEYRKRHIKEYGETPEETERKLDEQELREGFSVYLGKMPYDRSLVRYNPFKVPAKEKKPDTATADRYVIELPKRSLKVEIKTPISPGSEVLIIHEEETPLNPNEVFRKVYTGFLEADRNNPRNFKVVFKSDSPSFTEKVKK